MRVSIASDQSSNMLNYQSYQIYPMMEKAKRGKVGMSTKLINQARNEKNRDIF